MQPRPVAKTHGLPRDKFFWAAAVTLLVAQLVAFWMLCSNQVRQAELRDASLQVERTAIADCLRHAPDASLRTCAVRVAGKTVEQQNGAPHADPAWMSNVVPVHFAFR
jgi:hypothetical protein